MKTLARYVMWAALLVVIVTVDRPVAASYDTGCNAEALVTGTYQSVVSDCNNAWGWCDTLCYEQNEGSGTCAEQTTGHGGGCDDPVPCGGSQWCANLYCECGY